jgi:hypothetical protein
MTIIKRRVAVLVLAALLIAAALAASALLSTGNVTQTAAKAGGGEVAVVADAKAKE